MTVNTTLTSGDRVSLASPSAIPLLLMCCSLGVVGTVYTFDPGQDVSASLGAGIGVDSVYALLAAGQRVRAIPCTPTWSACPSVTRTGSTGPVVTAALTAGASGPLDDHRIKVTVKTGGANGIGIIGIAYDGTTEIETMPIPQERAAVLRGAVDISRGLDLEGTHLDFTAPTADVLTFAAGSLASSAAGLKAATATVAGIVTWTTSDLIDAGEAAILANARRLRFTTAGVTPSDAPASVAIVGTAWDGSALSETLNLAQTATSVLSVKAYATITSLTFTAADGTAATIAVGYSSAFADSAEIVTAFDALAVAAGLAMRARAAQVSTGEEYLEVYSTSLGAGVTATIDDSASTADTYLGFTSAASNLTTTGAAATLALPHTGITLTFPAGTYVAAETYSLACTGPRASIAALTTGATAAKADYINNPFGFLVVGQPADTAANCAATTAALSVLTAAWLADTDDPIYVQACVGSPFHVASSTRSTNETNIGTADAALLAAFTGSTANLNSVAVDDIYLEGAPNLRSGRFRRTAALAWGYKRAAAAKIAADVGDGLAPGSLLSPDGLTRARNESTATTKLGGSQGPGFSVLKQTSAGLGSPKFAPGATRAGAASRLRFSGVVGVGLEIARLVFGEVEGWDAQTWPTDPSNGHLEETFAKAKAAHLAELVNSELAPEDGVIRNYSGLLVTIDTSGVFLDDGTVPVSVKFVPLGEVETVNVDVIALGEIALAA